MLPPKALPSLARFWQHLNSGMNRAFNWKQASPRIIQRLLLEQLLLLLLLPPPLLPLPLLMCLLNQHLHLSWPIYSRLWMLPSMWQRLLLQDRCPPLRSLHRLIGCFHIQWQHLSAQEAWQ